MEVMKMTRIWKIIAVAASAGYMFQFAGCFQENGIGNTMFKVGGQLQALINQYLPFLTTT